MIIEYKFISIHYLSSFHAPNIHGYKKTVIAVLAYR
jgi:hypothetical protein